MDLGIKGRVALVTGGSRGLGRQAALSLAREGVDVGICGRTQGTLDAMVDEIRSLGVSSIGAVADVSDAAAIEPLHEHVVSGLGPIDILVNNVGGSLARADFLGTSLEDFKGTFDLNLFGGYHLMKLVTPHMQAQKWGRIVNIGGMSARNSSGDNASAGVRNAGLVNLTKYLAQQLGPSGVTVNLVHPGTTRTERSGPMYQEQARQQGITVEEVEARVSANNATKRIVDAGELAYVVAFLASPRSIAISGEVIAASGGAGNSVFH